MRRIPALLVLASFLVFQSLPLSGVASPALPTLNSSANTLQNGIRLYQQKKYKQAREELLQEIRAHPGSAEAFFYLGMSEFNLGNASGAEKHMRRALELNPRSTAVQYNLGVLLLNQKRPKEAVTFLLEAARTTRPTPELSVNLVRAYLEAGENAQAVETAKSAAESLGNNPAFNLAVGKLFLAHSLFPQAGAYLEKADRLVPGTPEIVLPLADTLLHEGKPVAARQRLENVAGSSGNLPDYRYLLAQSYFYAGEKKQALEQINQAILLDPKNPIYPLTLGRYLQKYGDLKQSLSALEQASRLNDRLPEIPYSIAVSYSMDEQFDVATKYLQRALQLDPTFDRALFLLGTLRLSEGSVDEAGNLLEEARNLKPQNPYYQCFYGILLVRQEQLPAAIESFRKSLELYPRYALAHYELGRVLFRQRKFKEAREELEKTVSLQPNLYEAYYSLSMVYYRLGQKEKGDKTMAVYQKYRQAAYSERQRVLKELQQTIQEELPAKP